MDDANQPTPAPSPQPTPGAYPVHYDVERQLTGRNRMTVGFRLILAIPHLLIVGGPGSMIGFPIGWIGSGSKGPGGWVSFGGGGGVMGAAAGITALISWFAILFTGKQPRGLWDFSVMYLRWRAKAIAYTGLLRDEYPPFSLEDPPYPVSFGFGEFPEARDKLSVGLRLIYAIPHILILFFVGIAWAITAFIGWLSILFTGSYPEGLYNFAIGYMRWSLRVNAYLLLMTDEYPPFSLD
jgi:hypothetical protein